MPHNITLQVYLDAPAQPTGGGAQKDAMRYRTGDIVAVYDSVTITEPPAPNNPMVFVHITGVPDIATLEKIRKVVLGHVVDKSDPQNYILIRKREWRIPPAIVPNGIRNQLINNREATMTWTQAKPYVRKKIINDRLNSSADDENTELADSDVS